jgi:hypothetical protein
MIERTIGTYDGFPIKEKTSNTAAAPYFETELWMD